MKYENDKEEWKMEIERGAMFIFIAQCKATKMSRRHFNLSSP